MRGDTRHREESFVWLPGGLTRKSWSALPTLAEVLRLPGPSSSSIGITRPAIRNAAAVWASCSRGSSSKPRVEVSRLRQRARRGRKSPSVRRSPSGSRRRLRKIDGRDAVNLGTCVGAFQDPELATVRPREISESRCGPPQHLSAVPAMNDEHSIERSSQEGAVRRPGEPAAGSSLGDDQWRIRFGQPEEDDALAFPGSSAQGDCSSGRFEREGTHLDG